MVIPSVWKEGRDPGPHKYYIDVYAIKSLFVYFASQRTCPLGGFTSPRAPPPSLPLSVWRRPSFGCYLQCALMPVSIDHTITYVYFALIDGAMSLHYQMVVSLEFVHHHLGIRLT